MRDDRIKKAAEWACAALTCFSLLTALNTDLSGIEAAAGGGGIWNFLAANIKKLEYLLPDFTYQNGLLAFFVFFFYWKTGDEWDKKISRLSYRIPAGLTAFFLVFGYSFRHTNSWDLIFMDGFHLMVSLLMMAGFYFLFIRIYRLLLNWLCAQAEQPLKGTGKLAGWIFEKHSFAGPILVILICWIPYILAKFPGAAMPETLAEMRQFYWQEFNNYYPFFHTAVLGLIMELGGLLGSYTLGFFLNLFLQLALLLAAFGYGFTLMKQWKTPLQLRCLSLAIICAVEFFPMESTVVEKDIPYTACVVFLVLLLYELVRTMKDGEEYSWKKVLGMVLCCLGVAVNRNEGFFLILAAGIGMSIYTYRMLWKTDRKKSRRILCALLAPVLLALIWQKGVQPALGVADNGPREVLSIPFQQTARYVRDYGNEISEEDAEILSRVLDYEKLAELYDPITSDPVKYTYHGETAEDLADYFGVWFRQLLKHPGNAVEATMNNVYGWFYQEGYAQNYMMTSRIEG